LGWESSRHPFFGPERLAEAERRVTGVPLSPAVLTELRDISADTEELNAVLVLLENGGKG